LRGVPTVRRGVPLPLRRALLLLCGAALTSGLAAPALAGGAVPTGSSASAARVAGLRLPERVAVAPAGHPAPTAHPAPAPRPVAASPSAVAGTVAASADSEATIVVGRGDTLWDLAAEQLGAHPSEEETAAAWPALYALNRDLIGPDPDLIEPGQRLVLPPVGTDGGPR
jgi:nucleoid-associated protein YgaU